MKFLKIALIAVLGTSLLAGETACNSMNNTGKGALIGGGGGAALGAALGGIIGGGKGAGIGTAIGAAVGTGAGALIGRRMDSSNRNSNGSSPIRQKWSRLPTRTACRPSR